MNRAAVVLLCAHLEGFLGDLSLDAVEYLNDKAPPIEDVPDALLVCHVDQEIETIAEMTDRPKRNARTATLFRSLGAVWSGEVLSGRPLDSDAIFGDIGNPKTKAIERMFARLGIDDLFHKFSLPNGVDPVWRLNELVDSRNDVAHGRERSVLDGDFSRHLEFVEDFASELDDLTARHLQAVCSAPQRPWL